MAIDEPDADPADARVCNRPPGGGVARLQYLEPEAHPALRGHRGGLSARLFARAAHRGEEVLSQGHRLDYPSPPGVSKPRRGPLGDQYQAGTPPLRTSRVCVCNDLRQEEKPSVEPRAARPRS